MGTFVKQLDGSPFAGANCGPASVASALRWSTRHVLHPTPSLVRERLGDHDGGTQPKDLQTAWASFADGAQRRGYRLPKMRYRPAGEFSALLDLLWRGDAAVVAVMYDKVPDDLSGDPAYAGGHSVFVESITQKNGIARVRVFDPLCDGRRQGIPGPGPVLWPVSVLRNACGAWAGKDLATYNAVSRAERITEPPDEVGTELEQVNAQLEAAQNAMALALAALRVIRDEAAATVVRSEEVLKILEALVPSGDAAGTVTTGMIPDTDS